MSESRREIHYTTRNEYGSTQGTIVQKVTAIKLSTVTRYDDNGDETTTVWQGAHYFRILTPYNKFNVEMREHLYFGNIMKTG